MADHERIHLFNGLTLDLARGCVIRAGEPIHLRPQSYEVLKYLAENKGRLISKDKLIEEVWKGRAVTDGSLGKCIEELGTYQPQKKGDNFTLDLPRAQYWMSKGALPSETASVRCRTHIGKWAKHPTR